MMISGELMVLRGRLLRQMTVCVDAVQLQKVGLVDVDPIVRDDAIRVKDVIHGEGSSETQGVKVEKLADRSIFWGGF
jgi:hypothetical protein